MRGPLKPSMEGTHIHLGGLIGWERASRWEGISRWKGGSRWEIGNPVHSHQTCKMLSGVEIYANCTYVQLVTTQPAYIRTYAFVSTYYVHTSTHIYIHTYIHTYMYICTLAWRCMMSVHTMQVAHQGRPARPH